MNNIPFRVLNLPELITDIQEVFFDIIDPAGHPKNELERSGRWFRFDDDNNKIKLIRTKYPFLSDGGLILKIKPECSTAIHIDGTVYSPEKQRNGSLNIPISGCTNECVTEFFDNDLNDFHNANGTLSVSRHLKSGIVPIKSIYQYSLIDKAILTHPQIPHRVVNRSNTTRVSVSWSVNFHLNWEQNLDYFSKFC
jgi:hypothetical protein